MKKTPPMSQSEDPTPDAPEQQMPTSAPTSPSSAPPEREEGILAEVIRRRWAAVGDGRVKGPWGPEALSLLGQVRGQLDRMVRYAPLTIRRKLVVPVILMLVYIFAVREGEIYRHVEGE